MCSIPTPPSTLCMTLAVMFSSPHLSHLCVMDYEIYLKGLVWKTAERWIGAWYQKWIGNWHFVPYIFLYQGFLCISSYPSPTIWGWRPVSVYLCLTRFAHWIGSVPDREDRQRCIHINNMSGHCQSDKCRMGFTSTPGLLQTELDFPIEVM